MTYILIKHLHLVFAGLTITGFVVRGYWMMTGSDKLQRPVTRILPHIADTVFLLSGIAMLVLLSLNPLSQSWLLAKLTGLVLYILFGTIAIRRGPSREIRIVAFVAALSVFAYVVGVALAKSPASWLAHLA
ncbi:MAG: SirB2 family protein [Gammaproteobacteria bacterium]|nr:SirB2 family protein [Gammaproteobacteria bacterium]